MKTVKIYRSILVNDGEAINTENIGNSWTVSKDFALHHADDINRRLGKDGVVVIQAEVPENKIDWSNTLYSMECKANEFEVVLKDGEINCVINEVFDISHIAEYEEFAGNVGSNDFEDYCSNYEGKKTSEDFFEMAENI